MKRMKILLLLSLSFLAITSCQKDKQFPIWSPGPMTFGKIEAVRNGEPWIASGYAKLLDNTPGYFFFQGGTVDSDSIFRENIAIQPISLIPGRYSIRQKEEILLLDGFCNASFSLKDYDVIEGFYGSNDVYANYVELIEYDSINQRVRGTFDIHFQLEWPHREDIPKRVHFSEGSFDIRLDQ